MADENNNLNLEILPLLEIEEEEEEGAFSLYRLMETLIENRLFRQTVENSMETYNNELFRKRDDVRLSVQGSPWTAEEDGATGEDERKCYICLEVVEVGNMVVRLECKHVFHKHCVENAVAHQHFRCPLCRSAIPTHDVETNTNSSGHRINFPE